METEFKTLKQDMKVEAHETLKLEKNSKGYNWEIKLFPIPVPDGTERLDELDIDRLERLNNVMIRKFSQETEKC